MAGLYAADGSWNVTVVDGATRVGRYAADGSLNVTQQGAGSRPFGLFNKCGAMNVTLVTVSSPNEAADGSMNVATNGVKGVQRVTLISGVLA